MKMFRLTARSDEFRKVFRFAFPYWYSRKGGWFDIMSDEWIEGANVKGLVIEIGYAKAIREWEGPRRKGPYVAASKFTNGANNRPVRKSHMGCFDL